MAGGKKKTAPKKKDAANKKPVTAEGETDPSTPRKGGPRARKTADIPSHIVGIGASAGGLEAFSQFFSNMPADSGMAFVLIPHLDPTHKSIMDELLRKYTSMPVSQVTEGMEVAADHVYVIPPDRNMAIFHGKLQLIAPTERRGLRHPIDYFLRTLAEDQGEKAIAVILSGTGTEGTLGLRAVKGEGGLVLVQDIKSAKYDGMPGSAIATGLVDYILPAEKMPDQLLKYVKRLRVKPEKAEKDLRKSPDALQKIFFLIRNGTGHDFSLYKLNTIMRRIERRMAVHQIERLPDYVNYLRDNPPEVDMLFKELLIRVTNFFRDPKAFDFLCRKVLPHLLDHVSNEQLRVWVPGCSTGEEAYSLAIMIHEYLTEKKLDYKIQVFATDIDSEAIETARNGIYPESISVDVSSDRLRRYFAKHDSSYRISKKIREMVVFAVQNIIKDPPFSRIDLISCRNLLIYLGNELQKKLIPLFHYSLKPEGILFLGSSETIGQFSDLFTTFDSKWKFFRPKSVPPQHPVALGYPGVLPDGIGKRGAHAEIVKPPEISLGELTEKVPLNAYTPPCVIINEHGNILYFHGKSGKYLEPAPGKASLNIHEMAREGLKLELRTAVRTVINKKGDVYFENLKVKTNGGLEPCNLRVKPISEPNLRGLLMVIFEEASVHEPPKTKKQAPKDKECPPRLEELEFELKSTKEQLQTTIEELEASNEELQSTNEELQSANEELQSTNEELETSKEELQSVNEELMTVNAESQNKIDELTRANDDMNNLLASTEIATIFLDAELRIKRFTPPAANVIKLIHTDIGRPISDIVLTLEYESLEKDVEQVLKTLVPVEKEVTDKSGKWYLMRILPYRTVENVIDGVVITFVDITSQKNLQMELIDARDYAACLVRTVREPLIVLDAGLHVIAANQSFCDVFKFSKEEIENRLIYDLGNRQWDIPQLREMLEDTLSAKTILKDFHVEHDFPLIGRKKMNLNVHSIKQSGKDRGLIILTIEDVTEKR
jgi:two-component system CheB/CheR fusion protein